MGWGRGGGRGWRNRFYATGLTGWQRAAAGQAAVGVNPAYAVPPAGAAPAASTQQQIELLQRQAQNVEGMLSDIKRQLEELQSGPRDT